MKKAKFTRKERIMIFNVLRLVTRRLGVSGFIDHITVSAKHLSSERVGIAYADCFKLHITVDPRFLRDKSIDVQRAIIAHEVCHLVNHLQNGLNVAAHGDSFFKLFRRSGFLKIEQAFRHRTGWPAPVYNRFPRR